MTEKIEINDPGEVGSDKSEVWRMESRKRLDYRFRKSKWGQLGSKRLGNGNGNFSGLE